jgi:hypothetical protein
LAAPGSAVVDPSVVDHHPRIVEEEVAGTLIIDHHLADGEVSISWIRVDLVHPETSMTTIARIERDLGNSTIKEMTVAVKTRHVLEKEPKAKDMIAGMSIHLAASVMVMVGEVAHGVSRLRIIVATERGEGIQRNDTAMRVLVGMMMTTDAVQGDTILTTRIVKMAEGKVIVTTITIDERIASTIDIAMMETISDGTKENTAMIANTGNESTRKVIDVVAVEAGVTKISNSLSKIFGGMKKGSWALRRSNLNRRSRMCTWRWAKSRRIRRLSSHFGCFWGHRPSCCHNGRDKMDHERTKEILRREKFEHGDTQAKTRDFFQSCWHSLSRLSQEFVIPNTVLTSHEAYPFNPPEFFPLSFFGASSRRVCPSLFDTPRLLYKAFCLIYAASLRNFPTHHHIFTMGLLAKRSLQTPVLPERNTPPSRQSLL